MGYKKPTFSVIALALVACLLASLCLMTYPIAQEIVQPENDENFGIENNNWGENGYSPYESNKYTANGVRVSATEAEPTDGKYHNFLLNAGGKKTEFSGEALSTFMPQVYRKNVARGDMPEIIVNFVTEHGDGVHKEQVHIFDLLSLEDLCFPDFVSEIASTMTIDETESYYLFKFSTRTVVLEKAEVAKRGIDLSGELIYDSCYRYAPYLSSSYDKRTFNLEMLWKEADGDVFARVYVFFYCENNRFMIADAQILFEDDKNADLDLYPSNLAMLNDESLFVSASATDTVFDDGKYHSVNLYYNDKKTIFDGELVQGSEPFVFLQDINVVCGDEIFIRLISDNSGGIYRETLHVFNPQTLERINVLDIGTQVTEELQIVETVSYYIVSVADSKVQFEKAELEKRGINIYEAIFDSHISYETFIHPETKNENFACKLLCEKSDGSVFGELYLLIYEDNGNYLTTSTYFEYVD